MRQLELQQNIDADAIFNFPNGPVSLDSLMPLGPDATPNAKKRRRYPRSSSAHWTDLEALQQNEVYAYNKAYDIKTGKVLVPKRNNGNNQHRGGNGDGGRGSNSEASGSRRSPLSQRTDAK